MNFFTFCKFCKFSLDMLKNNMWETECEKSGCCRKYMKSFHDDMQVYKTLLLH